MCCIVLVKHIVLYHKSKTMRSNRTLLKIVLAAFVLSLAVGCSIKNREEQISKTVSTDPIQLVPSIFESFVQ